MERLEALQEMFERKRNLENQIEVATTLRHTEDTAIQYVADQWQDLLGGAGGFEWEGVRKFLNRGDLSVDDLRQAIHLVRNRGLDAGYGAWKYFCGICWRWIKERSPLAAST
jgi:hypothetical protein